MPNIYTRLLVYVPSGFTLNPVPNNRQVSYERSGGVLRYSYSYNANNGTLIPDAIEESINVSDTAQNDVFAQIQVPGRVAGPVVQGMGTVTLPTRTITINIVLTPEDSVLSVASLAALYGSKPNVNDIILALKPDGITYVTNNTEDWNPIRRQYSRVVSWTIV